MCGIAGVLYADSMRPVESQTLRAMGDAVAHRGPDASGYWQAPGVGLAHRRLSIIDLSGGDQPIGNEDGAIQIVFNGEIYNYLGLRQRLIDNGHKFTTRSDTEVLVHLYEEVGERLVDELRGMFAFAIWDGRRRRLVLARDHVGQKPLYLYRDAEKVLFGSEIKAILAHPNVDRSIDCEALEDYLAFGMVTGARSIFKRIRKLPAANVVSLSADDLGTEPRRYWQLNTRVDGNCSLEEWQDRIRAKIAETLEVHKIADVSVGAFLSGGVDSSVIVAEASNWGEHPLPTFAIGFDEAAFNEVSYAAEVASRFVCPLITETVTCDAVAGLDDLVKFYDEPFADSSALPSLHLARLARRHVKVVLSGDGGDEAFGGYTRYAHDLQEASWRQYVPAPLRRGLLRALANIWPKADWLPQQLRAKTRLTNLSLDPDQAYANTLTLARLPLRRRLLHHDVVKQLNGHDPTEIIRQHYRTADPNDFLAGMISADVGVMLPDDFLTKVDRASMAHGVEVRPPLVDHELLELAATIPSHYKVNRGETKWILKETYGKLLPSAVTQRRKQGFDVPVELWLRGPLRGIFEDTVLSKQNRAADFIDQRAVGELFRSHQRGLGRHGRLLWALLVFGKWADVYLGNQVSSPN